MLEKMCAYKFSRVLRLFWDKVPMDHKMLQFFATFYIEVQASRTFYGTHPRQNPPNLSCWNEIFSLTSYMPSSGLTPARHLNELIVAYGPFSEKFI